jgi:uncharacterized protein YbaP (TraB family)
MITRNLKFLPLLILLVMNCFSLVGQTIQNENELLWEISGNGLKSKSYLYGSLHSNDKRLFRFSDSTYFALDKAQIIILETDVFSLFKEWDTRSQSVKLLYDNKGNAYTSSNEASKTVYGDEDGMPQFLDAYFLNYCYNAGKNFYPLERVEDQLDLAEDLVEPDGMKLTNVTYTATQERLTEFYLKGDISSIDRIMRANMKLVPGMYEDLITKRNALMVKGIDSLIRMNSAFCAVGAGHLAGEEGLINLLRKKGYRLRKVTASFTEGTTKEKTAVREKKEYVYVNDSIDFVAVFPGKPLETKIWGEHIFLVYRELGQGNTYSIEVVPLEDNLTLEDQAKIYIASPDAGNYKHLILDDGNEVYQGLSDTYPEGLNWVRLVQSDTHLLIIKAYGGNKFMNSNRPNLFFSKVGFE